jgi:hypothetical protein
MAGGRVMDLQRTTYCPYCRLEITGSEAADGTPDEPQPGSISVCIQCGNIAIFDDAMQLRPPTADELAEVRARHPSLFGTLRQYFKVERN